MQLEDLEHHWKRLDEVVDNSLAIETELLRRVILEPVHRRMNRMAFWPAVDVAFSIGSILAVGASVGDQYLDSRVLAPAVMVILCFLALLIDSILQLSQISQFDWSGPVSEIQSSLAKLRAAKIRQFKWVILLSPLWGFCGLILVLQWISMRLTGDPLTILKKFDPLWIAGNLLFGVVFALLGFLAIYVFAQSFKNRVWWQTILDGISGTSLTAARKDVELWASLRVEKSSTKGS